MKIDIFEINGMFLNMHITNSKAFFEVGSELAVFIGHSKYGNYPVWQSSVTNNLYILID